MQVSSDMIGREVNIGFHSDQDLGFWLQRPGGTFLIEEESTPCSFLESVTLDSSGVWLMTVATGAEGGLGPFVAGVSWSPNPPLQYLCGSVQADSLYADYSPYLVADEATIDAGHTLWVEPGVGITFEAGGALIGEGTISGSGSDDFPIQLLTGEDRRGLVSTVLQRIGGRR